MHLIGIIFALIALFGWTIGDFLIQRVTRLVGTIKTLFYIAAFGAIVLFPFAWQHFDELAQPRNLLLLALGTVVTFFAAVFDFEALHDGKLAVVEPIIGLELPLVVLLAVTLRGEALNWPQIVLIACIFVGITFVVTSRRIRWHHRIIFEKGFVYAGIGAIGLALTTFLYGVNGQESSATLTVWFVHLILALVCLVIMARRRTVHTVAADLRRHWIPILAMSVADNAAWIGFAQASRLIPISIATAISETYIVLAVILGLAVNHEKFRRHQYLGAALAVAGLIVLSFLTAEA
jgi:drug/metabolite transporter (DMT)-like permease